MEQYLFVILQIAQLLTIDNIRRSLSTFFSWLEEEDYMVKSPMKRIHKVKTAENNQTKCTIITNVLKM